MTHHIASLAEIASSYDAIVLDQWGVLHDGTEAYEGAIDILAELKSDGRRLVVLSNSGKRAEVNAKRIEEMGFPPGLFEHVMTSGEALWRDVSDGEIAARNFYPIERARGDAAAWCAGLDISLVPLEDAEALLLMGLPDGHDKSDWTEVLQFARSADLPIYCSNPDRQSPRAGGPVTSPGALGFDYVEMGGNTHFYGKPHSPIFRALERSFGTTNFVMVGDSLEHDIVGAQQVGWDSVLVRGGLYAEQFAVRGKDDVLASLVTQYGCKPPTFTIGKLQ